MGVGAAISDHRVGDGPRTHRGLSACFRGCPRGGHGAAGWDRTAPPRWSWGGSHGAKVGQPGPNPRWLGAVPQIPTELIVPPPVLVDGRPQPIRPVGAGNDLPGPGKVEPVASVGRGPVLGDQPDEPLHDLIHHDVPITGARADSKRTACRILEPGSPRFGPLPEGALCCRYPLLVHVRPPDLAGMGVSWGTTIRNRAGPGTRRRRSPDADSIRVQLPVSFR